MIVLEKVKSDALQLADSERLQLARALLKSVEPPVTEETTAAWRTEIERRIAEIDSGEAKGRPWAEVKREAESRFSR